MSISRRWFRNRQWLVLCAAAAALGAGGARAQAHTRMDAPPARDMQDGYKPTRTPGFVLPCGIARSAAQPVTTLAAGSTIAMKWTETVYHPGCFIIDFAENDTGASTTFQRLMVLPHPAGTMENRAYQQQVTLPQQPCTNCILRIRQYMLQSNPCPPADLKDMDANLYYSCANVVLSAGGGGSDGGADATADGPAPGKDGGGGGASGGGGGAAGGTGGETAGSGGSSGTGGTTSGGGGGATAGGTGGATTGGSGGASAHPGSTESSGGCTLASAPGVAGLPLLAGAIALAWARARRRRQPR